MLPRRKEPSRPAGRWQRLVRDRGGLRRNLRPQKAESRGVRSARTTRAAASAHCISCDRSAAHFAREHSMSRKSTISIPSHGQARPGQASRNSFKCGSLPFLPTRSCEKMVQVPTARIFSVATFWHHLIDGICTLLLMQQQQRRQLSLALATFLEKESMLHCMCTDVHLLWALGLGCLLRLGVYMQVYIRTLGNLLCYQYAACI